MILALDSSTPLLSVALVEDDGRVVAEALHAAKAGDALPHALLELAHGRLDEVRGIAAGVGPGSFTGLRVGLACAKALAYARKWPIAGVSSLRALAHGRSGLVCTALEARRGELFVGLYEDGREVWPEQVMPAAELPRRLGALRPVVIGAGALSNREALAGLDVRETPTAPPAAAIARLARLSPAFDAATCFALAPNYLAPATAEVALAEGRVGGLPAKS